MSEDLADCIWEVVLRWKVLARDTVGKQLIRAADSIGANVAEGTGRGTFVDNRRYFRIARASSNETQHCLDVLTNDGYLQLKQVAGIKPLIDELAPNVNSYLKSIGKVPLPSANN